MASPVAAAKTPTSGSTEAISHVTNKTPGAKAPGLLLGVGFERQEKGRENKTLIRSGGTAS
jgi:hypothetical protein